MSDNSAYEWLDQSDDDLDLALVCEYENPRTPAIIHNNQLKRRLKPYLFLKI